MTVYKVGDVVVEKVDDDTLSEFRDLLYRQSFLRREIIELGRDERAGWERLQEKYGLSAKYGYQLNHVTKRLTVLTVNREVPEIRTQQATDRTGLDGCWEDAT